MKKFLTGSFASIAIISATALTSSAATVDLPAEFSNLVPIFETILKIAEFLSKIISFFG